jgi:hypothetical protein
MHKVNSGKPKYEIKIRIKIGVKTPVLKNLVYAYMELDLSATIPYYAIIHKFDTSTWFFTIISRYGKTITKPFPEGYPANSANIESIAGRDGWT